VLTHWVLHEWVGRESPFTFVTDGIDSVLAQARAVARDNVGIGGGANVIRQSLATGLVEELRLRVAPVLLRVRKGLSDILRQPDHRVGAHQRRRVALCHPPVLHCPPLTDFSPGLQDQNGHRTSP